VNYVHVLYRKISHGKFSNVLEKVEPLLSGIKWDSQGNIIGAKATILNWILKKVREKLSAGMFYIVNLCKYFSISLNIF
jgi:hypothetical protein